MQWQSLVPSDRTQSGEDAFRIATPRVTLPDIAPCGHPEALAIPRSGDQSGDLCREVTGLLWVKEQPVFPVMEDGGDRLRARRDHGSPAGEIFEEFDR